MTKLTPEELANIPDDVLSRLIAEQKAALEQPAETYAQPLAQNNNALNYENRNLQPTQIGGNYTNKVAGERRIGDERVGGK